MNGHNASKKIPNADAGHVARLHGFGNAFLVGIMAEAFQNVAVSGGVAAENPAKQGNDPAQPNKIDTPPKGELGFPKVQNQQTSARSQHSDKLIQAGVEVGQISQPVGNCDPIKAFGRKGKRQGVRLDITKAGLSLAAEASLVQHFGREVHSRNCRPLFCQSKSHVASAAADVQSSPPGTNRGPFHQTPFPKPMQPETLQIVHQVIARRNPIKEPLYPLGAARPIFSVV